MRGLTAFAAAAIVAAICLTACGRGPVEFIPGPPPIPTITIELFVQGQISPSEGDYIFALNTNIGPTNVNQNENPGEPTALEAFGSFPPPFTHWDQVFVYGSNPNGLPGPCPLPAPNGYQFCYKAIRTNGGQNVISFVPIFLQPNDVQFNPSGNSGTGTGNALLFTMPIDCLSVNGTQPGVSCGTNGNVSQDVDNLYVNLLTLDNTGAWQDQVACLAAQTFKVDLTFSNTVQLTKPVNCPNAPSNSNLIITGGLVIVNLGPGPSPSPVPSPT